MKRSDINRLIKDGLDFCHRMNFHLPPFALWTPDDWAAKDHAWDEIRDCNLGWDITDFGSGRFDEVGLLLFTIRNGCSTMPEKYPKPYCEKLLIVQENQYTPYHYHFNKVEDIICRGGGNLMVTVYNRGEDDRLGESPVLVNTDGYTYEVPAGSTVRLTPGESITLPQYVYHTFWAEEGCGTVLSGEVSKVNDDTNDNRFLDELPRFAEIEEDEPILHYLCNEYPLAGS